MKKNNLAPALVISGAVALVTGSPAQAQSGGWDGQFNKRLYVGIGAGNSQLKPDPEGTVFTTVDTKDSATIATVGFDFNRRMSVELQFADLGSASLVNNQLLQDAGIEYSEISASALYYLWNTFSDDDYLEFDGFDSRSGFSLFGRVGAGKMENDTVGNIAVDRSNDLQFIVGVGAEYGWPMGLAARLEHIRYDSDANYTGMSLLYRFGRIDQTPVVSSEPQLPDLPSPKPISPLPPPPPAVPELPEIDELPQPEPLPDLNANDLDEDGVMNDLDLCPDTLAGTPVNVDGCEMFNGVIEGINFLTGSDTLTELARATLDDVVGTLQAFPDVRLSVEAHTDDQGEDAANLELSRRRALSVVRYLIAQGIAIDRMQARAYGESRPIADNSTKDGRLINRRVEFRTIQ